MDAKIRQAQKRVLSLFSKESTGFALAGGTALELYYLHHRFSAGLDFFSPQFTISEIDRLIAALKKRMDRTIHLESEMMAGGKARVRFYTIPVKGSERPLKIDFIEDLFFEAPSINVIEGVTLIIEPGVVVKFDGDYSFQVNGQLIAQGTPTEIQNNPDVIRAYLGEEHAIEGAVDEEPGIEDAGEQL